MKGERCLDAVCCDTVAPGARGGWDMGEAGPVGDAAAHQDRRSA